MARACTLRGGRWTSSPPGQVELVRRRGKPIRRIGLRVLGLGAAVSLGIDALTWLLTREGNLVRVVLGLVLLAVAAVAIAIGSLIDVYDRNRLGI